MNIDLKIEEEPKTTSDIKQIKPNLLLKNGEEVNFRYFLNSDCVFVSRGSKEHLATFLQVMEKVQEECKNNN